MLSRGAILRDGRYARNNYQFAAGLVLDRARAADLRPYRPALVRWTDAAATRERTDGMLSGVAADGEKTSREEGLRSLRRALRLTRAGLDGEGAECHAVVGDDTALHLRLFRPPRPAAPPLRDCEVPVLLRPEWQLHPFDWDL